MRKIVRDAVRYHACHVKRRWMSPSATPATQDDGGCHQVPRLPRKVPRRHGRPSPPSAPPELAQCHKCHACHVKRRWMSPSATPATQDDGRCHQVPRLPRKVPRRHRRPSPPKRATRASPVPYKCHACHVKRRWMSPSATQDDGGCRQVPRLPRKVPRRHQRPSPPKRTTRASPVP